MDLTASILAATRAPVPENAALEGRDLIPILAGKARAEERTLFWRIAVPTRQQRAVRQGNWKMLLDGDDLLLFDLKTDLGERRDLAARRPDIVRRLRSLLVAWEKDVDAEAAGQRAR
jgi:arylsulfatase A-like enzyme